MFVNEEDTLIRTPLDPSTGQPSAACSYALFPGLTLARSEPQLIVLLYDSILHQYPDTAMFLYQGRDGADPLLNRKYSERLLTRWRSLGKPTMIICTPEDMKFFRGILTEIPAVSLYNLLLDHHISGSCNHELYRLSEPEQYGFAPALKELAEGMGVTLYEPDAAGADALRIDPGDVAKIPFLTSSIDVRNAMKKNGFDAVHILELIFGMGPSNAHLEHTHDGGHEHHEHDAAPQIRETRMSPKEEEALASLFSKDAQKKNLHELRGMLLSLFWGE